MAKELSKKQRQEIETIIYKTLDLLDKGRSNSDHYKKKFAKMNDQDFVKFISLKFPYRFHYKPFEIEPTMSDAEDACNFLGIPLMERVYLPHLYENSKGEAVQTPEAYVIYCHLKKMQQFITKKNAMSTDIEMRDMKTGLLLGKDKNGKSSDRELQSLAVLGLGNTMEEFSKAKADAMESKNKMYSTINTVGQVSLNDIKTDDSDSLSRNLLNTYLIGANIFTNIISKDYYLPYTLKDKGKVVKRL